MNQKDFEAVRDHLRSCESASLDHAYSIELIEEVESIRLERDVARTALTMLFEKWNNGTRCYQNGDEACDSLGNAFKLTAKEEVAVLVALGCVPQNRGSNLNKADLCSDCPPEGWPTDATRCAECPRELPREPAVLGAGDGPAPMPTEEGRKAAWRAIYIATMVKHAGLTEQEAADCYAAGDDYDLTEDPEQSALDEMTYWSDDGDPA